MKKTKFIWYLLLVIPIILLILGYIFPYSFFSNQESIRQYVQSFGFLSPIIFILIQIAQVVITPINHYFLGIAGGFCLEPGLALYIVGLVELSAR